MEKPKICIQLVPDYKVNKTTTAASSTHTVPHTHTQTNFHALCHMVEKKEYFSLFSDFLFFV